MVCRGAVFQEQMSTTLKQAPGTPQCRLGWPSVGLPDIKIFPHAVDG